MAVSDKHYLITRDLKAAEELLEVRHRVSIRHPLIQIVQTIEDAQRIQGYCRVFVADPNRVMPPAMSAQLAVLERKLGWRMWQFQMLAKECEQYLEGR